MKRSEEAAIILNAIKAAGLVDSEKESVFVEAIKTGLKRIRVKKYSEKNKKSLMAHS